MPNVWRYLINWLLGVFNKGGSLYGVKLCICLIEFDFMIEFRIHPIRFRFQLRGLCCDFESECSTKNSDGCKRENQNLDVQKSDNLPSKLGCKAPGAVSWSHTEFIPPISINLFNTQNRTKDSVRFSSEFVIGSWSGWPNWVPGYKKCPSQWL